MESERLEQEEEDEGQFNLLIQLFDQLWYKCQVLSSQPAPISSPQCSSTVPPPNSSQQQGGESIRSPPHLPTVKSSGHEHQSDDIRRAMILIPSPKSVLERAGKVTKLPSLNQGGESLREEEGGVGMFELNDEQINNVVKRRKSNNKGRIQKKRRFIMRRSIPSQQAGVLQSSSSSMNKRRSLASEVEGFMDPGFVGSSGLVSGLQRLPEVENEKNIVFSSSRRDLLDDIEMGNNRRFSERLVLNKWSLPSLRNEVDMKRRIRIWAHTIVASAVR